MKKINKILKTLIIPNVIALSLLTISTISSCKPKPIVKGKYCEVETIEECSVSFSISNEAVHEGDTIPNFQYSLDSGKTWKEIKFARETESDDYVFTATFPANSHISLKGNNPNGLLNDESYLDKGTKIKFNNKVNLSGSIMSLLDNGSGKMDIIPSPKCFDHLFAGSKIVKVDKDFLPAKGLNRYCYAFLFKSCHELTQAPNLPATNLDPYCYDGMFSGCNKLQQAPELKAEYLEEGCYQSMFYGCKSLTQTPELRSTHLYKACYCSMFQECTGLSDIPDLPATIMEDQCYKSMFLGCTGLSNIDDQKLINVQTLSYECFDGMFTCCSNLKHPLLVNVKYLAKSCFKGMYELCTNLTFQNDYKLPALNMIDGCYEKMFSKCSSITITPEISAIDYAPGCFQSMFSNCTNLKVAMDSLPNSKLYTNSCYGMFANCISLTKAPALPSTDLGLDVGTIDCYGFMFEGCSELTEAPDLPATNLSFACYESMFSNCPKIRSIRVSFNDWNVCWQRQATKDWFLGATAGGTFYCSETLTNSAMPGVRRCPSGVPANEEKTWYWVEEPL